MSFLLLKTEVILSLQQIRPGRSILSSKCLSRLQRARIQAVRIHLCFDEFGADIRCLIYWGKLTGAS